MATSNINISVWRGSQTPPTNYHKWIKLDEQGNYLGQFLYRDGEWISDLKETEDRITEEIAEVNQTIQETKEELQTNIDNLEDKHDSDKQALTELINNEVERATTAEEELDNKIEAETTRATAAETELDNKIEAETNRAEQAEQELENAINTTSSSLTTHINDKTNPHEVTKEQIGLENVTNDAQVKRSEMGQPNGVATLDEDGKIPSTQLNGQLAHVFGVDGVATSTTLPSTGVVAGDIYYTTDNHMFYNYNGTTWDAPMAPKDDTIYNFRNCDKTGDPTRTNILYRWDGKDLTEISESVALGETVGTAYYGEKGAENREAIESLPDYIITGLDINTTSTSMLLNLNRVEKTDLNYGTEEVVDINIPVVTLTSAGVLSSTDKVKIDQTFPNKFTAIDNYTINGFKISTNPVLDGGDIKLTGYTIGTSNSSIAETDTINVAFGKLQLQINENNSNFTESLENHINDTNNPHSVTKAQVGLGNVNNTSDLDKPISTATQAALNTKQATLVSGSNIKTINGNSILGSGDIDFKTINGQELTGSGTIDFKPIKDINGIEQSPYGTTAIETLPDVSDTKVYGRSNGSWIDLTAYLTWYIE